MQSGIWNFPVFWVYKHPPHSSSVCTSWLDACAVPNCLQPHSLYGNSQWCHFLFQHCSCKSRIPVCHTKGACSIGTPKVLAVFIAWINLDLGIETCFFPWHGCLHSNIAAVCFPILHMDDSMSQSCWVVLIGSQELCIKTECSISSKLPSL